VVHAGDAEIALLRGLIAKGGNDGAVVVTMALGGILTTSFRDNCAVGTKPRQ
jgi:hypothetical protein